jgi:hypothetical protein
MWDWDAFLELRFSVVSGGSDIVLNRKGFVFVQTKLGDLLRSKYVLSTLSTICAD